MSESLIKLLVNVIVENVNEIKDVNLSESGKNSLIKKVSIMSI